MRWQAKWNGEKAEALLALHVAGLVTSTTCLPSTALLGVALETSPAQVP